ncbi:hypothetical protein BDGGKGIB_01055 [Nodularia sphaerocarpa UHCC 0038]|nr:hypothetical protein [Nodularia sphaerocarpa]ULP71429.1 hypothetical protein BDGGKGIB_01055 [Nodularia sphaerocarpa UHCC 0038]
MSTNTVKASDIPVVPFFARFLVEETPPQQPDNTPPLPPHLYFKVSFRFGRFLNIVSCI